MFKYILASGSPRRIELLKKILPNFEVCPSQFDESTLKSKNMPPNILVQELSYEKAYDVFKQVSDKYSNIVIIGGDTVVNYNNQVLGKPNNEQEAFNMLKTISGVTHSVLTGMSIIVKNNNEIIKRKFYSETFVSMKEMSDKDIYEYISTKEPLDKAGSYAIQGIGKKYVDKYIGNFNTVVGLNIEKLEKMLKELKVI